MPNKAKHTIIATLGYLLSPFSWWNDIFINIPLAYGLGFLFGLISKSLFYPMMILGYWLTNTTGLVMMHHGIRGLIKKDENYHPRQAIIKDLIFSIIYTLIIVVLIKVGWLRFPSEYIK